MKWQGWEPWTWGPEDEAFLPDKKYRSRSPIEEPHFLGGAFIHLLNVRSISFFGEPVHQKIVLMRTRHKKTSSIINQNQGQSLKILQDLTEWKNESEKSRLVSVYLPWEDARWTANKRIMSGGVGNPRSVHRHAHTWTLETPELSLLSPSLHSTSRNTTSGNVYAKQNVLCQSYQPKERILKGKREKQNPSQGQDGADMFGGNPYWEPPFSSLMTFVQQKD